MRELFKIAIFVLCLNSYAAYYDTLPKGVRSLIFRHVSTSEINSKFDDSNKNEDFAWRVNLDAETLKEVDSIAGIIETFEELDPNAAAKFTAGEFKAEAMAQVNVETIALAWGVNDRMTVYGYIPYYDAYVDVSVIEVRQNNAALSIDGIDSESETVNVFNAFKPILQDNLNLNTYQSIFQNSLGYQPVGDWEGRGIGDTELGVLYRMNDEVNWGWALSGGLVVPTGQKDETDVVQDIGFGDGQWDVFSEVGAGYDLLPNWEVDSYVRYTYQLPSTETLRIPESEDFPYSSDSALFRVKRGDKIKWSLSTHYSFTDWVGIKPEFFYEKVFQSDYKSNNYEADRIYEIRTDSTSQEVKIGLNFTTLGMFRAKKFPLPLDLNISGQRVIKGNNTPKFSRFDLEVRAYF